MTSIGEALINELRALGVDTVFGIPGVHTVELYRGLAASGIRHITPRHEQGAGFMADGYARASGKPGVAFVITGPGLTNTLTPMAQARADSIPILVVSGVNGTATLGKGMGHLHELPDQYALASSVALVSEHVATPEELGPALNKVFRPFGSGRPGPTHIQIPLDVAALPYTGKAEVKAPEAALPDDKVIAEAAMRLAAAEKPLILAGGGAKRAGGALKNLAERIDAPVVQTVNARGVLFGHPLGVPASPSLKAIRTLIEEADLVLALGTELGPTDYDMYATGAMAKMTDLVRVDRCAEQLARHAAEIAIQGDVNTIVPALLGALPPGIKHTGGAARAERARIAALAEIGPDYRAHVQILEALRTAVPGSLMVGDSAQPIYAGNLYYDHDRAGGWFNAATGYGALGYGIPAAIGASVADPQARVICLSGDGGAQFSLPEVMAAVDEDLPVTFVIWNNHGYREIASAMQDAGVEVVGCDPTPPDFAATAKSFGIPHAHCAAVPGDVAAAMTSAARHPGPSMIEIVAPRFVPAKDTRHEKSEL
ncbi:5-guanidino-2-oxopentanoate decarboxylase [Sedimentitalea sp. JM2-8]|uniref:5-guanidino-2-oxopentanoate decarboxylase n=1 Tax=Sedimentitalea xiamensis TaxID=3050037 RepID=A0ABT7FHP5_9RHOB|nr:5-guanidino-2-oxopentanoate decarboxylase [Sedimentitalea xiamensis]MDK3074309.1 5-guanidino-2-oxopentanoate decarboxylase [Sedimentitalea xiamensis]